MANNLDWPAIAKKVGFNNDKDMLRYYYEERKMGSRLVAKLIGVSRYTVLHRSRKLKIKIKPRGGRNNINPKADKFEEEILGYEPGALKEYTSREIMAIFDIPKFIFYRITKRHNIKYDRHHRNEREPV